MSCLRVLIIEDDEDDATLLLSELRALGYAPEHRLVETEAGLIAALDAQGWDLILSDYSMPGFSGLDALALIRARGLTTPFILISGTIGEDLAVEAIRAGASDYLLKGNLKRLGPATARELRDAATRAEEKRAQERFRALFESSRDAIMTAEPPSWRYTSANPAAVRMFAARDARELCERSAFDLSPALQPDGTPSDGPIAARNLALAMETGGHSFEWTFRRLDGVEFTASVLLTRVDLDSGPILQGTVRDITAQKRADTERSTFMLGVARSKDAIFMTDPAGRITFVNAAFERLYGLAASEAIGRTPRILKADVPHQDLAFHRTFWEALCARKTVERIITNKTKDGRLLEISASVTPIVGEGGELLGFLAIQRDITEEHRIQQEIEILARFPAENPNPVLRIARDGTLLYANGRAAPIFEHWGCKVGQHVPQAWCDLVESSMESDAGLEREVSFAGRSFSMVVAPFPSAGYANVYGRDITERQKTLRALQRSHEEFRSVLDKAPYGITIRRGRIRLYANAAFASYHGLASADELMGEDILERVQATDRDRVARRLAETEVDGSAVEIQVEVPGQDGVTRTLEFSPSQVIEFEGERCRLTMCRDVTEQNKLQAHVLLSDRMASIGTLAAGVAHEINNPLAAVILNVDMVAGALASLRKELPDAGVPLLECGEMLSDARMGAERVRQIVQDLKLFSRAEELQSAPVDIHRMLDSTLRMAWNEIRHRARLVKDFGKIRTVDASESRLAQVFLNLVVNAAQAIPEGQAEHNEIRVLTGMAGDRVVIEVRDTGAGIPDEIKAKLFTPFFTTKPVGQGTGLGLSICYRIVQALGGEIQVESEVGKGTTFRVFLRSSSSEGAPEASPPPSGRPTTRRGRLLAIDDELAIGRGLERSLRGEHDVALAGSAMEALGRIRAGERFDVILCDLMMPEVTGMDLYEQLLHTSPDEVGRIVFVTGGAFTPRAREFLATVPNLHLEKPFDLDGLRAILRERLRSSR